MSVLTSIWNELPEPVFSVQPEPFEYYNHYEGMVLYKTKLVGRKSGLLKITDLHDYATVFIDGKYIGTIDRKEGQNSIEIPEQASDYPVLEILVEGMGRINFAQEIIDRKGITERVTLNGMTLMNWDVYILPLDKEFISGLRESKIINNKPGIFFSGEFTLTEVADTYIDMSTYTKGIVWVNGNNLGKYWNIGPQQSLYCPASFMKKGKNDVLVFDIHQTTPENLKGIKKLI
jgi:hypothetical protein